MKKLIAIFLTVCIFIGLFSLGVSAEEMENFVDEANSTFESGDHKWGVLSGGKLEVVDNPVGEGKVLKYSGFDPSKTYATPIFDVRKLIQDNVDEEVTIYGSMDVYCAQQVSGLLVRLRTTTENGFSLCQDEGKNYCTVGTVKNSKAEKWSTVVFSFDVLESDLTSKEAWNICFDGISRYCEDDFYIDNLYIGLEEPEIEVEISAEIPEKTKITRNEDTLVGTIRWDAFTKSTPGGTDPASQVARVLSPAKYHWQAPFFAKVEADNTISFPEYTVDIWEQEAGYAVQAGIDYFAYLWYNTEDAMSQPRKKHLESEKKDTVKMCGILEAIRPSNTMDELFAAMQDSCYLSLDGRPVVFLYGIGNWKESDVAQLRSMAAEAGIKASLYIIGMEFSDNANSFLQNVNKDIDAMSWYSVNANATAESYTTLAQRCESVMAKMASYAKANKIDFVPAFTAGRDTRARIETGVSWVDGDPNAQNDKDKPYSNLYALSPTMAELQQHMENVISFAYNNQDSKANLVCSYGWNEHEEGGWLCPTLACDEEGNVLLNDDGSVKVNNQRLEALKAAIANVKNASVATPAETTATPAPTEVPQPDNESGFKAYYVIIPIAVILIAAVTVVVIKKKKK